MARANAATPRAISTWVLIGAALVLAALHPAVTAGRSSEVVYLVAVGLASTAAWSAVRRAAAEARRVAALLAGGVSTSGAAGLVALVPGWFGSDGVPAHLPDLLYVLGYGLVIAALAVVLVRGQRGPGSHHGGAGFDALIDALTVVTVVLLVLWNVSVDPVATGGSYDLLTRLSLAAYPILDGVTLALAARAAIDARTRSLFAVAITVAAACWLVGDLSYEVEPNSRAVHTIFAVTGMVGAALIAVAAAAPIPLGRRTTSGLASRRAIAGRLAMANLPLAAPAVLLAAHRVGGTGFDVWATLLGSAVLLALSCIRIGQLLMDQRETLAHLAAARDTAIEAARAKSELVATVSHEIRTPMNGVLGLTDLLLATQLDQRQRQYVAGVRGAGEHLLTVVNEVLDFAKAEAGKLELEEIDFTVADVLDRACDLAADPAARKGVELIAFCAGSVPTVLRGDPTRLTQAVLNLVGNAVKFTDEGAVVASAHLIRRTEDGAILRFEVRDTGMGISDEDQQRLFRPFTQVSSSTTRRFGGTGLGLTITQQLVAAMGGDIGVTSHVGAGSTFWFTVPLRLASDLTASAEAAGVRLHDERVLIVTSNVTSGVARQQQLAGWGMRADLARDAAGALRSLRDAARLADPYHLVLTALRLRDTDGLQLTRAIAADTSLDATVVLLLTRTEAAEIGDTPTGAALTLLKPVPSATLLHTIGAQLGRSTTTHPVDRRDDGGRFADDERASHAGGTTGSEARASRGHVLVVDDAEINQIVAEGLLAKLGYTSAIAEDGEHALDMLALEPYDAVLMDCQMPVLDGFEATRRLRETEGAGRRTPVIALTGSVSAHERDRCLAAGMDDYLVKPISPAQLEETLLRWVPVRQA